MTEQPNPIPSLLAGGGPADAVTVRYLRLDGSQRAIGRALAAAAEAVHGTAAHPRPIDPTVERARRRWFDVHHRTHRQRMVGIADHFGLDPDDSRFTYDWLDTYDLPAGCSVAFYPGSTTADGHGLLSRNFDFPTATLGELIGAPNRPGERPLAADVWVVEQHPETGYASLTVAIMDVMGAMDGINEAGLAVALLADNETPEPEPSFGPQVGLSEQQVVRYLLDHCATADEARQALLMAKHYYFFTPCHFVVADRSGAAFVWEHSPRRNLERVVEADPRLHGRLVCTNHLLHRRADPFDLPDDEGPLGTAAFTYTRYRTLASALTQPATLTREEIRDHFRSVRFEAPLEGGRTFWHGLYDVDRAAAELTFFVRDESGVSRYSEPWSVELGDRMPALAR